MNDKPRCAHPTTRGRPCRNPALPGTEPPVCALHRRMGSDGRADSRPPTTAHCPLPTDPLAPDPSPAHLYFPRPAAADLGVLAASAGDPDLRPEIDLARVVLRRLMTYLEESAGELPPEELRRVAGLVFTGARTVAMLLGKRPARPDDAQQWLAAALTEMGEQHGWEL